MICKFCGADLFLLDGVEDGSVFANKSQLELAIKITQPKILSLFFMNVISKFVAV